MKKLLYLLLFFLPLTGFAQIDISAFYGTNVARAYGADTVVGYKAFNTNGAGLAGLIAIAGTDSAGFGVNASGQLAIQSGLSKNAIRLYNPVGIPSTPAASAILDISSTTKGFLLPRMTTAERDLIAAPATGLMIYNTTTSAFNYYNAGWQTFGGGGITIGGTAITSGTDYRVLFQDATASDFVTQTANFTIGSVATGYLDVPVGYAIAGSKFITLNTATRMTNIGYLALGSGANSTFLGHLSGGGGNTGERNTYMGARTGGYSAASGGRENTGIGDVVLASVTSGNLNTFLGAAAGATVTSGSYKIGISPYDADASLTTTPPTDNNNSTIVIGVAGYATAANQGILGSQDPVGYISNWYFNGVTHTAPYSVTLNASGGSAANGASMTIQGGAGGGTDKNAGGLILTSGISTGTGTGSVSISTPTPGASGTGTNGLTSRLLINHIRVQTTVPIQLSGYTVATLPATPAIGDIAYVTDALAPAYGAIIAGGGAVATIVFYNGVNWISH